MTFTFFKALKLTLLIAVTSLSSCASDPMYSQLIGTAGSNFKGEEIIGAWTSDQSEYGQNFTLLLRPNGTGILRYYTRLRPDYPEENNLTWLYAGNGIWNVSSKTNATIRYNGGALFYEMTPKFGVGFNLVFVRPYGP